MDAKTFADETQRAVDAIKARRTQPRVKVEPIPYHGFTGRCNCGSVATVDRRGHLICERSLAAIHTYD